MLYHATNNKYGTAATELGLYTKIYFIHSTVHVSPACDNNIRPSMTREMLGGSIFKIHQNRLRLGLCHRPNVEAHHATQTLYSIGDEHYPSVPEPYTVSAVLKS